MSAGDYILLIIVFYFPPFSSPLWEPHLLPSLSEVKSLPPPPPTIPFASLIHLPNLMVEDYLSDMSSQYFTAVGGESSPAPDHTWAFFKTNTPPHRLLGDAHWPWASVGCQVESESAFVDGNGDSMLLLHFTSSSLNNFLQQRQITFW